PGTYSVYLTASYTPTGQSDSVKIEGIEIYDVPKASFKVRSPIYVPDTQVEVLNYKTDANEYNWHFEGGATTIMFEPTYSYSLPGTYIVTLIAGNNHGDKDIDGDGITDGNVICYDTARHQIVALDGGGIQIPNAFTPSIYGPTGGVSSSTGINDVFLPLAKGVRNFKMQIFNRWGIMIFESNDSAIGWDGYDKKGTLMPAGVYVYKLVLDLEDGHRNTRMGDVTLIR